MPGHDRPARASLAIGVDTQTDPLILGQPEGAGRLEAPLKPQACPLALRAIATGGAAARSGPPIKSASLRACEPLAGQPRFFQRSGMEAGPPHVPAALRAATRERSDLAARFVALLWRAPLVQSARGRAPIKTRGIFMLRVRLRFVPPSCDRRCARTRPRLHAAQRLVTPLPADAPRFAARRSRALSWRTP